MAVEKKSRTLFENRGEKIQPRGKGRSGYQINALLFLSGVLITERKLYYMQNPSYINFPLTIYKEYKGGVGLFLSKRIMSTSDDRAFRKKKGGNTTEPFLFLLSANLTPFFVTNKYRFLKLFFFLALRAVIFSPIVLSIPLRTAR